MMHVCVVVVPDVISLLRASLPRLHRARGGKRKKEEGKKEKGERKEREIPI